VRIGGSHLGGPDKGEHVLQEFKDFINKGSVIDLAVAVIIGGAFALVIGSFTADILTPIIGAIFGQETDFSRLSIDIGDQRITYGNFINVVINFLIIAFALFLVVKAYNATQDDDGEADSGPSEVDLLTEIRDSLANR
jgi:large conductance mechanosensitive channel